MSDLVQVWDAELAYTYTSLAERAPPWPPCGRRRTDLVRLSRQRPMVLHLEGCHRHPRLRHPVVAPIGAAAGDLARSPHEWRPFHAWRTLMTGPNIRTILGHKTPPASST